MWLQQVFAKPKAIVGMVHLKPLPGTPLYDAVGGMQAILEAARKDLHALQAGGIDGVMFCNENDRPYLLDADSAQVAAMAYVVGCLKKDISVPFGMDVLWDPIASISLAHATGAAFVREIFTGTYGSDMGIWAPSAGKALRHRRNIGAENVKVLFNINAEFASPMDKRSSVEIARSVVFGSTPDAICVSGAMTGSAVNVELLQQVKAATSGVPVFVNTGVKVANIRDYLQYMDGAIVGTSLKRDGITWNPVDQERVEALMKVVNESR